ncbi:MAG: L,D-transpeptidase, partial [Synergistaceae bacterium]|nr:L,D-transpeptidase [Synergistaceae bacterium]
IITPSVTAKSPDRRKIVNNGKYRIDVNKSTYTLTLYQGDELIKEYPIAIGRNPGDKQRRGDHRTPVGNFKIVSIESSSSWSHDFRDGKGKIKGAYGPWFLRLDAKGWKGIGIHGTHDPDSRGTMATEGCIRLSNEDIAELRQYAYRNMPVTIREN